MEAVAAGELRAGDVVRLDDPQAHRVERVVLLDVRVLVELARWVWRFATRFVTLLVDRLVERLGTAAD